MCIFSYALKDNHFSMPRLILARAHISTAVQQCCFIT